MTNPIKVSRAELQDITDNPRLLRSFERLFGLTGAAAETLGALDVLPPTATVADIERLSDAIDALNVLPPHEPSTVVAITGGSIDGTVIGGDVPAAGTFTNLSSTEGIISTSPSSGIGYAVGAGGAVTQLTSKATGVTLNRVTGTITMNAASLAAAEIVSFVLTNTTVSATDMVVVVHQSGGTLGAYGFAASPAAGSVTIAVRNNIAAALAEAIVLRYVVIKSVNS